MFYCYTQKIIIFNFGILIWDYNMELSEILEFKRINTGLLRSLGMIISSTGVALAIPACMEETWFNYIYAVLMFGLILLIISRFNSETLCFDFSKRKIYLIKKTITSVKQSEYVDFSQIRAIGVSSLGQVNFDKSGQEHEGIHRYEIFINYYDDNCEVIEKGSLDKYIVLSSFNDKLFEEVNTKAKNLAQRIGCKFLEGRKNHQIVINKGYEAYLPLKDQSLPPFEIDLSTRTINILIAISLLLGIVMYTPTIVKKIQSVKNIKVTTTNNMNGINKTEMKK